MENLFFKNEFRKNKNLVSPILAISYALIILIFLLVIWIGKKFDIPYGSFTRDPASIVLSSPFIGILSNIGNLFWTATTSICFFVSFVVWRNNREEKQRFLFFTGIISSILLFDDLFLVHEYLVPKFIHLPEHTVFLSYALIISAYLLYFKKKILDTNYWHLLFALFFFACSIACDELLANEGINFLIEDGFKFLGIFTWFFYFSSVSYHSLPLADKL